MKITSVAAFVLLMGISFSVSAWGADIHVPGDFGTIQEAVNAAASGDTVHVAAGTYMENVLINGKTVHLTGAGKETTVIDGNLSGSVIHLFQVNSSTISNFTLQNAQATWPHSGILLNQCNYNAISGVRVTNNDRGIYLQDSSRNLISDSDLLWSAYQGILLWGSALNRIENCLVDNFGGGTTLIEITNGSPDTTIIDSVLKNTIEYGILMDTSADRSQLYDNVITRCGKDGISVDQASSLNIVRQQITSCLGLGMRIYESWFTDILSNSICDCGAGMWLMGRSYFVRDNRLEHNNSLGIRFSDADDSQVYDNIIKHHTRGLWIRGDDLTVRGNVISHHDGPNARGIWCDDTTNCQISKNHIVNNTIGLELEGAATSGNGIYQNSFSNNGVDADENDSVNIWYAAVPWGGNFWSDYSGLDLNGDGFGDTPVTIPGVNGSVDANPCMVPHEGGLLWSDTGYIKEDTGGIVNFSLEAAEENANRYYLILGSITGTEPGIPLPGGLATLPLTWDVMTDIIINRLNTPTFANFLGILDANGKATAQFKYLNPVKPSFIDKSFYFAYTLADPGPFDYVSHVMEVDILDF